MDVSINHEFKEALLKEKLNNKEIEAILAFVKVAGQFRLPELGQFPTNLKYRNLEKNPAYKVCRLHQGQRKLLMTEVLFITQYGNLSNTIVYAGAAPGTHILILETLFPRHKFILWDPVPFDSQLEKSQNIELHNECFTDESAQLYTGKDVIFISDIRSDAKGFDAFEKGVHQNNVDQRRWIEIMKPIISSLKFRIPFTHKGPYQYLDGTVYMQPWAPEFSAETRLVTDGKSERKYNPVLYENELHYYNNVVREFGYFPHGIDITQVKGLCYCSDCCYEVRIWKMYFKIGDVMDLNDTQSIINTMNNVSAVIKRTLLIAAHGVLPTTPMYQKRKHLKSSNTVVRRTKKTIKKK